MRLLVPSSIFLLVILIAPDGASAKKCGREKPCRKERSAALEKTNYGEKDCPTKYSDNDSRNGKRCALDECQLEHSKRKDSSMSDRDFEECKDSRKKSRNTEKPKKGRSEEKLPRRKEETSRNHDVDKSKCKSDSRSSREQRKSNESGSKETTCRKCSEETSEYANHGDEDVTQKRELSAEDSSASDDSE